MSSNHCNKTIKHNKNIVNISADIAYIRCDCGWESIHGYDMSESRIPYYESAEKSFTQHLNMNGVFPYSEESRPCCECINFKDMGEMEIPICTKLLMGVTRLMRVSFLADKGTCFESNKNNFSC